jgi:hypothetical protein
MSDEKVISVSSSVEENSNTSSHKENEEDSASEDVNDSDDSDDRSENLLELCNVVSGLDAPGTFACGQLNTILPGKYFTMF